MQGKDASTPITLAVADFLLSAAGRAAAQTLQTTDLREEQTLVRLNELRKTCSAEQAGALLALARLRLRAVDKFPQASELFFTPEALEQATAWPVAEHRAVWFAQHAPPGPVLDLGCGIGGDALALARYRPVIALERDPLRLRFAQANAEVLGLGPTLTFQLADWTALLATGQLPLAAAAFADPARRQGERRVFSLHQMQPPLADLLRLHAVIPALGVKVMPSVPAAELPGDCGVEFVSHAGVCKEAVLWFGPLAQRARWASVHTEQGWLTQIASGAPPPLGELQAGFVLHEPDPAVIRAGALAELCDRLAAHLFDPQIAYLASPEVRRDPLVQSFLIHEVRRFSIKVLNGRLQALGIGQVELKKRGFPSEPESLRPQLRLAPGGRPGVILFTRRGDERLMLIGERLPN